MTPEAGRKPETGWTDRRDSRNSYVDFMLNYSKLNTDLLIFKGLETYDNLEAIKRKEEAAAAMASREAAIDEVECLPVVNNVEIKPEEQPQQPQPPPTRPADQCGRHNRRNINEWILTNDTIG